MFILRASDSEEVARELLGPSKVHSSMLVEVEEILISSTILPPLVVVVGSFVFPCLFRRAFARTGFAVFRRRDVQGNTLRATTA